MPSDRVAKVLALAAGLRDEERAELADELWSTVPEEISPEWRDEIQRRVREMNEADARGEPAGRALSFEELVREVKACC